VVADLPAVRQTCALRPAWTAAAASAASSLSLVQHTYNYFAGCVPYSIGHIRAFVTATALSGLSLSYVAHKAVVCRGQMCCWHHNVVAFTTKRAPQPRCIYLLLDGSVSPSHSQLLFSFNLERLGRFTRCDYTQYNKMLNTAAHSLQP
jgi:hypothetical protein